MEKKKKTRKKRNALDPREISSLVVRVSPQNGAQEARQRAPEEECSRLVSETREKRSGEGKRREVERKERRRGPWYRIKGVCHILGKGRRGEEGEVRSS